MPVEVRGGEAGVDASCTSACLSAPSATQKTMTSSYRSPRVRVERIGARVAEEDEALAADLVDRVLPGRDDRPPGIERARSWTCWTVALTERGDAGRVGSRASVPAMAVMPPSPRPGWTRGQGSGRAGLGRGAGAGGRPELGDGPVPAGRAGRGPPVPAGRRAICGPSSDPSRTCGSSSGSGPLPEPRPPDRPQLRGRRPCTTAAASLRNIYAEIRDDLGLTMPAHGDLTAWADRGVMLLNRVLTVRPNDSNSHRGRGWEEVTSCAIDALSRRGGPLAAILWGSPRTVTHGSARAHPVGRVGPPVPALGLIGASSGPSRSPTPTGCSEEQGGNAG